MQGEEDKRALFSQLKQWFRRDMMRTMAWRRQALEDYAFYNGEQWSDADKELLRKTKRPLMTFNRIAPLVNAVIGAQVNNPRQVRFIPRKLGDAKIDEILSGVGDWFRYNSHAEDEEAEAFADTVIAGMGWIDTRMDFDSNPEGDPVVQRLDPFKMVWDADASKNNLIDAKRLWYVEQRPIEEARLMFADVLDEDLHAAWAVGSDQLIDSNKMVTIVEARWFEHQESYLVLDNITGERVHLSPQEFVLRKELQPDLVYQLVKQKVVKRAFLGNRILSRVDTPLTPQTHLGWECITGYYNRYSKLFYGLVQPTKDPQRWSNKFFSQVMYLLNSQAKGGLLAERGAFDDDVQAEESFARADQITWLRNGALSGGAPRIQPKPVANFPTGFFQLFEESKVSITQVTGLSPEFIGTRSVNQSGVLENQRRQSSLNLLATIFNNLKRYRKRQAMIMLYIIRNFMMDGRLVRIVGAENQQYVNLSRDICDDSEYDIIVDDVPSAANEKERTFEMIEKILPIISSYMTPQMAMEILKYTPLPTSLTEKWAMEAAAVR